MDRTTGKWRRSMPHPTELVPQRHAAQPPPPSPAAWRWPSRCRACLGPGACPCVPHLARSLAGVGAGGHGARWLAGTEFGRARRGGGAAGSRAWPRKWRRSTDGQCGVTGWLATEEGCSYEERRPAAEQGRRWRRLWV